MRTSPLTSIYDNWTQPSYEVRVRGIPALPLAPTFLWGSAGINVNISFDKPLVLHVRNNPVGEPVNFGTVASGGQTPMGTLQPGECVSIPLQNVTGIFATCATESTVACLIKSQ